MKTIIEPFKIKMVEQLRIATADDIPSIAAVVNAAFEIEAFHDGTRTDENNIAEMMRSGEFLLLVEDDCSSKAHRSSASGHLLASVYVELHGERGYFGMFAVEPSRQGHGLARVIVEAAEKYCWIRGCKWIDVKVLSPRTVLLPFYHRLGFVETGVEEFPSMRSLKPGVECHFIRMSKPL